MRLRCIVCATEFEDTDPEIADVDACPRCGSRNLPCDVAHDISLKINWTELRVLTNWAEAHAEKLGSMDLIKCIKAIIDRLEKQRPEDHDNYPALTLAGEIREMQALGYNVSLVRGDGSTIVPKTFKQ